MSCDNCKLNYPCFFKINNNNYCYFCRVVYFLEQKDIFSVHIGYSIFDQDEIIKKTKNILSTKNKMPSHTEIDPNSKLVLINPFILKNLIKIMSQSEQICFSNIKIFFSEDLDTNLVKIKRLIDKPIIKTNILPQKIQILPHQKVLYDKYFNTFLTKFILI